MMRRRTFMCGAASTLLCSTFVEAQQPGKTPRIGILDNAVTSRTDAFLRELRGLGWIDGQNVALDTRIGPDERFSELARQLIELDVSVIFAPTTSAVHAVRKLSTTVPVVFALAGDPVTSGLVMNLARPAGQTTGLTTIMTDLTAKRLEFLKQVDARLRIVAVLLNPKLSYSAAMVREVRTAASRLTLDVRLAPWEKPSELADAFAATKRTGAQALIVLSNPMNVPSGAQIAALALKHHLPSITTAAAGAIEGALLSYGPNFDDLYRRAAVYVHRILNGTRPGDLPVERPTTVEFVVNLKTAKTLGLTIPPSLLLRADQVIE